MQIFLGKQAISPVAVLSGEKQEFHELCATYRLYRKQMDKIKNRIYSLLRDKPYRFTPEEVVNCENRRKIRSLEDGTALALQLNMLFDLFEHMEAHLHSFKEQIQDRLNRICIDSSVMQR